MNRVRHGRSRMIRSSMSESCTLSSLSRRGGGAALPAPRRFPRPPRPALEESIERYFTLVDRPQPLILGNRILKGRQTESQAHPARPISKRITRFQTDKVASWL